MTYQGSSNQFTGEHTNNTYSVYKFTKLRKQPAILRHTRGKTEIVAYFTTDEHARQFCQDLELGIHHNPHD